MNLNAKVAQRVELSPELIILRVIPDAWELPDFKPGQFAVLGLPGSAIRTDFSDSEEQPSNPDKLIKRAYSIASSSTNKEYIEFYVALVRSGALTPRLFALKPGDSIFLGPKFTGMFTLDMVKKTANIIMLSTGTGLAPYMSMIRTVLNPSKKNHFVVVHGARHSWDLGYRSELMTLRNMCDKLTYVPVISRPNKEMLKWSGQTGYIQDIWNNKNKLLPFKPNSSNTHVLLCGNPGMIDGMVEKLSSEGYTEHTKKSPGNIHLERYW
jgi:ferredoxin--NADP+ reductase